MAGSAQYVIITISWNISPDRLFALPPGFSLPDLDCLTSEDSDDEVFPHDDNHPLPRSILGRGDAIRKKKSKLVQVETDDVPDPIEENFSHNLDSLPTPNNSLEV